MIGGTIKGELPRADVEQVLLDGFFPDCPRDAEPVRQRTAGPAGTRPALRRRPGGHEAPRRVPDAGRPSTLANREPPQGAQEEGRPDRAADGGPLQRRRLQGRPAARAAHRACSTTGRRTRRATPVRTLAGTDLDLAVARGAAYYGLVRRGKGVRIRGGTARAYYVGVETALPAVPGCRRRSRRCASCRSAWRRGPRPTCRARSSAWSSASRPSSASSARPSAATTTAGHRGRGVGEDRSRN